MQGAILIARIPGIPDINTNTGIPGIKYEDSPAQQRFFGQYRLIYLEAKSKHYFKRMWLFEILGNDTVKKIITIVVEYMQEAE